MFSTSFPGLPSPSKKRPVFLILRNDFSETTVLRSVLDAVEMVSAALAGGRPMPKQYRRGSKWYIRLDYMLDWVIFSRYLGR